MRIAINCSYFVPFGGGIKEYIFNLSHNLSKFDKKNNYILYVSPDYFDFALENLPNRMLIKKTMFSSNQRIKRGLFERKFWMDEEKNEKFDVFHSPFFHCPSFKNAKTIMTVHDLRFKQYPSTYSFLRYIYLLYSVKNSIKKVDKIISISNFTKKELIRYYNIDANKIHTIHEAVNSNVFKNSIIESTRKINNHKIVKEEFLLTVGHLEPRKNYNRLIKAYIALPYVLKKKYNLIIVGRKNYKYNTTLKLVKSDPNIKYLDFVSNDDLNWLYANCKAHVFPSIYEGFGFPSLEAGIYSKVTIASKHSAIPEVTGLGGIYFNPFNIENIAFTLEKFLIDKNLQNELSLNAKKNINNFSWETNALKTLELYENLVN